MAVAPICRTHTDAGVYRSDAGLELHACFSNDDLIRWEDVREMPAARDLAGGVEASRHQQDWDSRADNAAVRAEWSRRSRTAAYTPPGGGLRRI